MKTVFQEQRDIFIEELDSASEDVKRDFLSSRYAEGEISIIEKLEFLLELKEEARIEKERMEELDWEQDWERDGETYDRDFDWIGNGESNDR